MTVADYISRAESQSRQSTSDNNKNKDVVSTWFSCVNKLLADHCKLFNFCLLLILVYLSFFFFPISVQGQVEAIAEHSPPPAPATTNGSNNNAADSEGSNAASAPRSSSERPAKVSYKGDSNPQPVVNGLS